MVLLKQREDARWSKYDQLQFTLHLIWVDGYTTFIQGRLIPSILVINPGGIIVFIPGTICMYLAIVGFGIITGFEQQFGI